MPLEKAAYHKISSATSVSQKMIGFYENLELNKLGNLRQLYTEDISFEDPAHSIQGIEPLIKYFESLIENLESCQFKFHKTVISDEAIFLSWTMFIKHRRIRPGQIIRVEGASYLKTQGDKVFYHRDYFDLGAMVYENIPFLGGVIRQIKNRLGQ